MFTINNKNVEDILKEHDIIEKFQDLQNALYQLFYTTLRIEKNMETWLHFNEALTLYLVINSDFRSTNVRDIMRNAPIFLKYETDKRFLSLGEFNYSIHEASYIKEEFIKEHEDVLLRELDIYGKSFNELNSINPYNAYNYFTLDGTMLHALESFNGKVKFELSTMLTLFAFCAVHSPINNLPKNQKQKLLTSPVAGLQSNRK